MTMIGTTIGSYEVVGKLGEGGMGQVYRARDTRLGRSVALKVISDAVALDADRIARFDREAKVLASLNHPRIATLYGVEESAGRHFLVMELVEGETLADRLQRGAMPVADALAVAQQIAEALEAAHECGVIHRDLKPANVKVTPDEQVKVLDFGLAKAIESEQSAVDTNSPTLSMRATQMGVILGTAAYMSPEQAKGARVDHRSDIFSFGVVLYEMLAGRRPFQGDTAGDVLASVIVRDADLDSLPAAVPLRLRDLLRRCLEKQPKRRWQAIGDVRAEIETIAAAPEGPATSVQPIVRPSSWTRVIPFIGVAALASGLTYVAVWRLRPTTPQPSVVRFSLTLPEGQQLPVGAGRRFFGISPDGNRIAYFSRGQLFLRSLSDLAAIPVQGVETAQQSAIPAFSPDSQSIAFWASDRTLKRMDVRGGAAVTICPVASNPRGLSWGSDGIVFTQDSQILRVSASGGNPELLLSAKPDEFVDGPQVLPDGETILFTVNPGALSPESWDRATVVAQSLKTGERKTLVSGGADGRYLSTGHLVYVLGGTLIARSFDFRRLEDIGPPVPVLEGVRRVTGGASGAALASYSNTGSLVYVPGPAGSAAAQLDVALSDRKGSIEPLGLPPASYVYPRVSPDGKQIALGTEDGKEAVVWVYDLAGRNAPPRKLTFGGRNRFPVWSSDSQRIAFQSDREGDLAVFWERADGTGVAERLTKPESGTAHIPDSWSRDGDHLAVTVVKGSSFSLATHSVRERKTTEFDSVTSSALPTAVFSRDGRWLAYSSSDSGSAGTHVYVQPFPPTGARYQVFAKAAENPHHPLWSPDDRELFYIPRVGGFEAVRVITQPTFAFGNSVQVPRVFATAPPTIPRTFDITPTGKIVSIIASGQTSTAAPNLPMIHVVLNWFEELTARVPGAR